MPIAPLGKVSLTKFIGVSELLAELARLKPGETTAAQVRENSQLNPLWNDLVLYEPRLKTDGEAPGAQIVQDDELLEAAREQREDAPLLVWCSLMLADSRLDLISRTVLTSSDGKLDPTKLGRQVLQDALEQGGLGEELGKVTTNILRDMVNCELFVPNVSGASIVGVERLLPTAHAVPGLVRLVAARAAYWGSAFQPVDGDGDGAVDFALALGANHWLGLTRDEFKQGARKLDVAEQTARGTLPDSLTELADQLATKGQVVLQGPPGTGKTYLAKQYVDWATGGRTQESRLQAILDSLPTHERTPERVADGIQTLGLAAAWDIVQFHPSYEYNDFVRTLVAEPVAGGVTFVPKHRVLSFIAAVGVELERRGSAVELVLILDEINRGNIPSIFGELLYALEYRGEPVATPYAIDGRSSIIVPQNLRVIGTMNTADRSIAVIDYALRRRFVFLEVPSTDAALIGNIKFQGPRDKASALKLYGAVRELLAEAAPGMQVGASYFMPPTGASSEADSVRLLASGFVYEVLPLLAEYVQEGEIEQSAFETFKQELDLVGQTQATLVEALTAHLNAENEPSSSTDEATGSES